MTNKLALYAKACAALAEAKTIDEVKEIKNQAEAARAYAIQAQNRQLELDALEIRTRAERKLGEILIALRSDGSFGQSRHGRQISLTDLGINKNIAPAAQRLAKLPTERFEGEIAAWRDSAEHSQRVEVPLQKYRLPSTKGDRQRFASRVGRLKIESGDPLARFRDPSGRRVADWRFGELDRIRELASRVVDMVDGLKDAMPVANPDPLDTMEMIFRDQAALAAVIAPIWDRPINPGDAGINGRRIQEARERRSKVCEQCQQPFLMKSAPQAKNKGRFCSRTCAHKAQRRSA